MSKKSQIIDFKILDKLQISVKDYMYLAWKQSPDDYASLELVLSKHDTNHLQEKGYIKIEKIDDTELAHLRQEALDLLEYLKIDSFEEFEAPKIVKKSNRKISAEVVGRIDEYRNKWKGRKAGSMGSRQSCIDKLSRWIITNPEYSFDDVLRAADIYLETEGMNSRYLQRADYFIYKQENNREESSRLSAFIDELDVQAESSRDWTSTLN